MKSSDDPGAVQSGKPKGRPRVEESGSRVSTWLPTRCHDQLIQMATRREVSVSAFVRQIIIQRLK